MVENSKGVHDAVGKDPSFLVLGLKLSGVRSEKAYQVFKNCNRSLTKTEDDTKWKKCKDTNNERLKNRGRFGMNTRTCWMIVEEQDVYNEYLSRNPGLMLLLDQSCIQDT